MGQTSTENIFLGVAFEYPFQPDEFGQIAKVGGREAIRQNIAESLSTQLGTRYMFGDYGSKIHFLSFDQNDEVLRSLLRTFIQDAIFKDEKRVKLMQIDFEEVADSKGVSRLKGTLTYEILGSNEIDSFIFPFYELIKH